MDKELEIIEKLDESICINIDKKTTAKLELTKRGFFTISYKFLDSLDYAVREEFCPINIDKIFSFVKSDNSLSMSSRILFYTTGNSKSAWTFKNSGLRDFIYSCLLKLL